MLFYKFQFYSKLLIIETCICKLCGIACMRVAQWSEWSLSTSAREQGTHDDDNDDYTLYDNGILSLCD